MAHSLEEIEAQYGPATVFSRNIAGHEYQYALVWDSGMKRQRQFSLGRTDKEQSNAKTIVKYTGMNNSRSKWDLSDLTEREKRLFIKEQIWVLGRFFMTHRQAGRGYQSIAYLLLQRLQD